MLFVDNSIIYKRRVTAEVAVDRANRIRSRHELGRGKSPMLARIEDGPE
jgi:hypothetical protein